MDLVYSGNSKEQEKLTEKGEKTMFIQFHILKNFHPSNLNRDDLGAPKTCYFGGYRRARISSQCIKRNMRVWNQFFQNSVRTKYFWMMIEKELEENGFTEKEKIKKIYDELFSKEKNKKKNNKNKNKEIDDVEDNMENEEEENENKKNNNLFFTPKSIIPLISKCILEKYNNPSECVKEIACIIEKGIEPEIALFGRMIEISGGELKKKNLNVEAAAQVSNFFSTHEVVLEVDFFTAVDDMTKTFEETGSGHLGQTMFNSSCYYGYASISWNKLIENLKDENLALETTKNFLQAFSFVVPTGFQNRFASNPVPSAIIVEIRKQPLSYSDAFVVPVPLGQNNLIKESIKKLNNYMNKIDNSFFEPEKRFYFTIEDVEKNVSGDFYEKYEDFKNAFVAYLESKK